MALLSPHPPEFHRTGESAESLAPMGSLSCVECGYALATAALDDADDVPRCPACGGSRFRQASLFEHPTVDAAAVETAAPPSWLDDLRGLEPAVPQLAFQHDGEHRTAELRRRWTRIGRSETSDVVLDDPSVSRRHALIVRTPLGELRALDDRSLNGLFVNGKRVEWAALADGDELEIGRFRLYVVGAD